MSDTMIGARSRQGRVRAAVSTLVVTAMAAAGVVGLGALPAQAAVGDGALNVRVVNDRNIDGARGAEDVGLANVAVTVTDAAGTSITLTTNASGLATLPAGDTRLVGGAYRVEVANPDTTKFTDAKIISGHAEPQLAPTTTFVNLGSGNVDVSVGFIDTTIYGNAGARIYSAIQPNMIGAPDQTEVYTVAWNYPDALTTTPQPAPKQVTKLGTIGNVYGVGVDGLHQMMYAAAYAKAGAPYGPGGAGAIYRINPYTGATEVYATIPNAGTTPHADKVGNKYVDDDASFRPAVGRESLGDLEVSPDYKWITTVNLATKSLVVLPVQATGPASPIQTLVVPTPDTCTGDWTPFAIEDKGAKVYVGATCGQTLDVTMLEYSRGADGSLSYVGVVGEGNIGTGTKGRTPASSQNGPNQGAMSACWKVQWRTWDSPMTPSCMDNMMAPPGGTPVNNAPQFVWAQPILADIVVTDSGQTIFSLRDRASDLYGTNTYVAPIPATGGPGYGSYIVAGDIVNVTNSGGVMTFNQTYNFQDTSMNPSGQFGPHNQAAFAGIANLPGTDEIAGNQMDSYGYYQNGLRTWDISKVTGTNPIVNPIRNIKITQQFSKGAGLADLEAMVVPPRQQIGNRIWIDKSGVAANSGNGIQDADEPAVAGVKVNLLDANGQPVIGPNGQPVTATTDANGDYYFATEDGLLPETGYTVQVDPSNFLKGGPLAGYSPTTATAGSNTGLDSNGGANATLGGVTAAITTPVQGRNDHTIDFGFTPPVSIGDYVWVDTNGDGLQNASELPLAGITVELLDASGNPVLDKDGNAVTAVTDANGYYAFTDLPANTDFQVKFPTKATVAGKTYDLTKATQGSDTEKDSNPNQSTGIATVKTPASGNNSAEPGKADNPTIDAGYVPAYVSIGNKLWIDADGDGLQGASEKPVADAVVELLMEDGVTPVTDANGDPVTATTNAEGYYVFTNLDPSQKYVVKFPTTVEVDGHTYALTVQGSDPTSDADSNPDPANGKAPVTAPASGNNSADPTKADNPTIDAGYKPVLVSIGDRVWIDVTGDGVQDGNELPVAGIDVKLLDADGDPVLDADGNPIVATTDADGYYAFTDLPTGTKYIVEFPKTVKAGGHTYALTAQTQGTDTAKDSNADPSTGQAPVTTPMNGANSSAPNAADNPTIDAGYTQVLVSIGNKLWIDTDGDGVQDADELPVPHAVVQLMQADGVTPVTDASGNPVTATTDANGNYVFTDLEPDTDYVVVFPKKVTVGDHTYELTKQGPGQSSDTDSDADPATGQAKVHTPMTGENSSDPSTVDVPTIDAGYKPVLVSIGDRMWIDVTGNGIQDGNELPIAGVVVKLLNADGTPVLDADGKPVTTTTDADGYYAFTDLPTSTDYIVEFPTRVTTGGHTYDLTTSTQGDDPSADSNADQTTGRAPVKTPIDGSNSGAPKSADNPTIDAGYTQVLVSIGNKVWIDANANGIQDGDELPVPGVKVQLLDNNGNPVLGSDGLPRNAVTDANGNYVFTDLEPDTDYFVKFPTRVVLEGVEYKLTPAGAGDDRGADSNPNPESGLTPVHTPSKGENLADPNQVDDPTIDAGYKQVLVSIGDRVWIDKNGNGVQDGGEPSVPGVTVKLYDAAGTLVATTTTDKNGNYVFPNLMPSTVYYVEFPKTVTVDGVTYVLTAPGKGSDSAKDSDADPNTGRVKVTTPADGENGTVDVDDPTIDAGYVAKSPDQLSVTGAELPIGAAVLALIVLLGGGGLLLARRRAQR